MIDFNIHSMGRREPIDNGDGRPTQPAAASVAAGPAISIASNPLSE
jgi:hypothetical protein